ncbi:MAG: hypothetical protein DI585_04530 [Pseudomonas fluorescens]|nr:MAG: hypothetical protein DI585_04530 [Pseudomonas fluorescens]
MKPYIVLAALILSSITPVLAAPNSDTASVFTSAQRSIKSAYSRTYETGSANEWQALLLTYGIANGVASNRYDFDYRSAIEAFNNFTWDTSNQPAQWAWWLQNQRVIVEGKGELTPPPAASKRLQQEYEYHRLARDFYDKSASKDALQTGLRKIAYTKGHSRQKDAARTFIRVVTQSSGADVAWEEVNKLQSNAATQDIYPYIEDTRFILMTGNWWNSYQQFTPAAREKMLTWLLGVVQDTDRITQRVPTAQREDFRAIRMNAAMHHINLYLVPDTTPLDWWLTTSPAIELGPRQTALKKLIHTNESLAWMQLDQTQRLSAYEWLYKTPQDPVWQQTTNLATHAFNQYQSGKGREWLLQAIDLARPEQSDFATILNTAQHALQNNLYTDTNKNLQARLGKAVFQKQIESKDLEAALQTYQLPQVRKVGMGDTYFSNIPLEMMNWYIHQGDLASARNLLTTVLPDPYNPKRKVKNNHVYIGDTPEGDLASNMVILAQTEAELDTALLFIKDMPANNTVLPVLNLLPRHKIYNFVVSNSEKLSPTNKVYLLRLVATRAWLLNDAELLKQSAILLNKNMSGVNASLLNAMDGDDIDRLKYVLEQPRMRPMAAYKNDGWERLASADSKELDTYNHNDNNWWCSYKPDANQQALNNEWARVPDVLNGRYYRQAEVPTKFAAARQTAFAAHPITQLVDEQEQQQIAAIPQAPEYLTKRVLSTNNKKSFWGFWSSTDKRLPEMLHLAVRTTRYGCNREGSHQSYSFDAFRALHKNYPESIWAQATPYWFQ